MFQSTPGTCGQWGGFTKYSCCTTNRSESPIIWQSFDLIWCLAGWEVQLHLGDVALHARPWSKHPRRVPPVRCPQNVKSRCHYSSIFVTFFVWPPCTSATIYCIWAVRHLGDTNTILFLLLHNYGNRMRANYEQLQYLWTFLHKDILYTRKIVHFECTVVSV